MYDWGVYKWMILYVYTKNKKNKINKKNGLVLQ